MDDLAGLAPPPFRPASRSTRPRDRPRTTSRALLRGVVRIVAMAAFPVPVPWLDPAPAHGRPGQAFDVASRAPPPKERSSASPSRRPPWKVRPLPSVVTATRAGLKSMGSIRKKS